MSAAAVEATQVDLAYEDFVGICDGWSLGETAGDPRTFLAGLASYTLGIVERHLDELRLKLDEPDPTREADERKREHLRAERERGLALLAKIDDLDEVRARRWVEAWVCETFLEVPARYRDHHRRECYLQVGTRL